MSKGRRKRKKTVNHTPLNLRFPELKCQCGKLMLPISKFDIPYAEDRMYGCPDCRLWYVPGYGAYYDVGEIRKEFQSSMREWMRNNDRNWTTKW